VTVTGTRRTGPPSPAALDELQERVGSIRRRHDLRVTATVALLDTCAELGELVGAFLKDTGYSATRPATNADAVATDAVASDAVRAEFGDVLFALLSFADAAGLDAHSELLATLSRYETRFAGNGAGGDRHG